MTSKPKGHNVASKTSNYYTLYLDRETFNRLSELARANGRTKVGQLRVMVGIK